MDTWIRGGLRLLREEVTCVTSTLAIFDLLLHLLDPFALFFDLTCSLRGSLDLPLLPCRVGLLNLLHFLALLLRLHVSCDLALDIFDRALSALLLFVGVLPYVLDR